MAIGTPTQRYAAQSLAQGATTAFSPTSTVAAGSVAIIAASCLVNKTIASVTDSVGNTWSVDATSSDGTRAVSFASCQVTTQITTGNTITITWTPTTSGQVNVWVQEVTGLATSSPFDKTASGGATGTALATGTTAALAQADEIVWGVFRTSADITWTKGTSYSNPTTPLLVARNALEYKIVAATTGVLADGTANTSVTWAGLLATYKGVASGATYTGSAVLAFTASVVTAGYALKQSTTALPVTISVATAGLALKRSVVTLPFTASVATTGYALKRSTVALPITLSTGVAGQALKRSTSSLVSTLAVATAASQAKHATSVLPLAFAVATTGVRKTSSAASLGLSLGVGTGGSPKVSGSVSLQLVTFGFGSGGYGGEHYGSGVHGYVLKRTSVSLPITLGIATTGARKAVGSVGLPITLAVATAGTARTVKSGSASLAMAVDVSTSGFKTTSGVVALPLAFGVATNAVRTTSGVVALPLTLAVATGGATPRRGTVSLVLVLNVVADTTTIVFLEPIETGHIGFGGRARIEEAERGVLVR